MTAPGGGKAGEGEAAGRPGETGGDTTDDFVRVRHRRSGGTWPGTHHTLLKPHPHSLLLMCTRAPIAAPPPVLSVGVATLSEVPPPGVPLPSIPDMGGRTRKPYKDIDVPKVHALAVFNDSSFIWVMRSARSRLPAQTMPHNSQCLAPTARSILGLNTLLEWQKDSHGPSAPRFEGLLVHRHAHESRPRPPPVA